ncbi:MAG: histidine phosphatase family protein [Ktedonobacterales bacterium]
MRLLLVRHGATANNAAGRFTGQTDSPMSALGERQARALAARLAPRQLDGVVSSDLQRASLLATAIAEAHGVPLRLDPALREFAMGGWEGATFAEIQAREPERFQCWRDDPLNVAPPGGESVLQVRDRLVGALDHCRAEYPDGTVLWVTHGGCIGVLLCHLLGVDPRRRWQFRKDNAALSEIELGELPHSLESAVIDPLSATILRLNDTCHLDGMADSAAAERFQVL